MQCLPSVRCEAAQQTSTPSRHDANATTPTVNKADECPSYPPSLQEERHQLQLHPPVSGDDGTLRLRDSKSRPGSVTPTMRVSWSVRLRHIMYSSKTSLLPARSAHWAGAKFALDRLPVCQKDAAPLASAMLLQITFWLSIGGMKTKDDAIFNCMFDSWCSWVHSFICRYVICIFYNSYAEKDFDVGK